MYFTQDRIRRNSIVIGVAWTALLACSYGWFCYEARQDVLENARVEAQSAFEKDALYRRWAASLGGLYVKSGPNSPPNPYLTRLPERDISTPSGQKLTLVNPAYMTRLVYELAAQHKHLVRGHITSVSSRIIMT